METIAKTAEDKIRKGIINLQKPQPFFAYLLMMMKPKLLSEEMPMQTMGVDAKGNLHYARKFAEELNDDEMLGVLCHETLHVALLHMIRRGNRNPVVSNIAQDVVVNMMVRKADMKLPKDTIAVDTGYDRSEFDIGATHMCIDDVSTKAWEEIYVEIMDALKKDKKNKNKNNASGGGMGNGPPSPDDRQKQGLGFDNHMEGDGGKPLTPEETMKQEQKWQSAIAEAAHYAKQQGNLPAGMDRYVDDLLKPQVQWKAMLLKYLRPFVTPVDWTYQRPHKKSQVLEVFLPNVVKESCEVEVIVDTSGSIAKKELTEFLSEIVSMAQSMNHLRMHVTFVDTEVGNRYVVEGADVQKILAMQPTGGGGTSMLVGLQYVKEHNHEVPVVIVFTDGYDTYSGAKRNDYPFDVIWVLNEQGVSKEQHMKNCTFGSVVKME